MGTGKTLTIPSREGFGKVFSKPDYKTSLGPFKLFGKKNSLSSHRIGVSIKKRDYRLATNRNLIKRKIRGSFLLSYQSLPPMDYVVLVRRGISSDYEQLKRDLLSLWKKTKRDCEEDSNSNN